MIPTPPSLIMGSSVSLTCSGLTGVQWCAYFSGGICKYRRLSVVRPWSIIANKSNFCLSNILSMSGRCSVRFPCTFIVATRKICSDVIARVGCTWGVGEAKYAAREVCVSCFLIGWFSLWLARFRLTEGVRYVTVC